MEASPEDRAKIVKALEAGRVSIEPGKEEAIGRMFANGLGSPSDFTLTKVEVESCWGKWNGNDGGFEVAWQTVSAGAGGLTFYLRGGKLHCDNESMSQDFIKGVLSKMVDEMELDWKKGKRTSD